ncbi:MAG TPA: hypothetical protein VLF41_01795 [Candidatus Nanoarchaeia archaeon]|nr:hypothetical protein [Candidatus Nanoarchaeia archaeon]
MSLQFESLHNHTKDSDGHESHLELLDSAEKYDIGVVAFTDHDQLPDAETLKQLRTYQGPVRWLVGIELSSDLPKEITEQEGAHAALHVLGLFIDPTNQAILDRCQELAASRIRRMKHFVVHLTGLGFKLTEADCLEFSGNDFVGSPHIVKAIEKYPENHKLMQKMMDDMKAAGEKDENLKFLYDRMIKEGPRGYPYVLFMKKSSFISMPPADFGGALLDLDANVELIRQAGGVAVLAHWWFDQNKLPTSKLEELLSSGRLDGIETDVVNMITERDVEAESLFLRQLAGRHERLQTIGSDAHDAADLAHFAKSDAAKRSIGQTERLIQAAKPNLRYTSLIP